ncbi:MAG TPA: type II toxin-antitoxin system HicA family toxin [bacterium]|nr:type II toxin-antitoxin system HicA family toxin [bacterium]
MTNKALLKLVKEVIDNPKDVDFRVLKKLLELFGYDCRQPRSGSSHYNFRKEKNNMITIPKHKPVKSFYVKEVIKKLNLEEWYEKNS